ncbi:MAG: hypothetical protein K0S45_3705 [Nitrospira sp.]|jgi:hypothetical protein|nr:hypothetical protein [Nitrospira sp.]
MLSGRMLKQSVSFVLASFIGSTYSEYASPLRLLRPPLQLVCQQPPSEKAVSKPHTNCGLRRPIYFAIEIAPLPRAKFRHG